MEAMAMSVEYETVKVRKEYYEILMALAKAMGTTVETVIDKDLTKLVNKLLERHRFFPLDLES